VSEPFAAEASGAVVNVARFLPDMAARQPDTLALRVPRGRGRDASIHYLDLTFAQLDAEADAWAHRLAKAGIARGMRVLLLVKPGLSLIALCFALFKTGAVPVVIDPGMGLRSFLRCVRRTEPEAVVSIPRGIWVARLFRGTFATARARVVVRADEPIAATAASRAEIGRTQPAFPVAPTRADELAAILFTSGSTGAPKGVCYEHGMFEAQVRSLRDVYGIQPGEVDLPMLPVFALFNPALGMTTVVPELDPSRPATVDPVKIVQAIRQCGVTNSFGSPVLWRKIADHCLRHHIQLPTLRRVFSAGAPVPPQLMADMRRVLPAGTMHSPYGATEALPVSTVTDREILEFAAPLTAQGRGTCVGRPAPGVDVRIVRLADEPIPAWDDALVLPPGQIGEIVVQGAQVTRVYDRLPAATAAAKIEQHSPRRGDAPAVWHRMGDCGYLDADGRLWFCGRKAERVLAGDAVHFTDCCEGVFNQHPRVLRSALIGLGVPGCQEPAIVIEPKPGQWPASPLGRAGFAEQLRELAAAHAATRDIHLFFFHRRFPVDVRHNAKIHRLALARHFAKRRPVRVP
jgi:olefin beta-lactone synthetase